MLNLLSHSRFSVSTIQSSIKQVADNVLAMKYLIPAADVSLVTSIELKDEVDNVISSNIVNIPIAADHLMIQSITVKEGDQ